MQVSILGLLAKGQATVPDGLPCTHAILCNPNMLFSETIRFFGIEWSH